jgi:hypothetical protein
MSAVAARTRRDFGVERIMGRGCVDRSCRREQIAVLMLIDAGLARSGTGGGSAHAHVAASGDSVVSS